MDTGQTQYSSPFLTEVKGEATDQAEEPRLAYWGELADPGTDVVWPEVVEFQPPADQPVQARDSLTKTVPNAKIVPNRVVITTAGAQYERWKQATSKELRAFLKIAWKEPTPELRACYFAAKKKVHAAPRVQLKPMIAEEKAQDEYEKARICLQGQNPAPASSSGPSMASASSAAFCPPSSDQPPQFLVHPSAASSCHISTIHLCGPNAQIDIQCTSSCSAVPAITVASTFANATNHAMAEAMRPAAPVPMPQLQAFLGKKRSRRIQQKVPHWSMQLSRNVLCPGF